MASPGPMAAAPVMPLKSPPPQTLDWPSMGLPQTGWIVLVDQQQCDLCDPMGDMPCVHACAVEHDLAGDLRARPAPRTGSFAQPTCNQCENAPCADICPVGAISHNAQGIVELDQELCIGCRFCEDVCPTGALMFVDPYQVSPPPYALPGYSPDRPTGLLPRTVAKCTLCTDRILAGLLPSCVESCPNQALFIGNLDRNTATNGRQVTKLSDLLARRRHETQEAFAGAGTRVVYLT